MLKLFDGFPDFAGVKIQTRENDGYVDATQMEKAMTAFDGKAHRFSDWTARKFTTRLLDRLSERSGIIPMF